ncbi:MAG: hypothetical protein JWO95_1093 [Verrucomicrobiales bacterium]|nr:hypothetical protein [Verrucomicrobiales bacterium]
MQFRPFFAVILTFILTPVWTSHAEISKGHSILVQRGFQILALTQPDNYFHLDTYTNAGYTTVGFSFNSTGNLGPLSTFTGPPPGFPWARWAPDESNMPGQGSGTTGNGDVYSRTNEIPHLSQLVALQLQDEWNLNDDATRTRLVNWFVAERTNWPTTILYHNNWGYQLTDAALSDYINRAKPDMLSFDTYPWESVWDINQPNHIGAVIPGPGSYQLKQWFSELRQYREYARAAGIPMGIWRQTWHGVQDYDQHVYRDPSPSELRLNTFGAIAFSVKFINDFTYNTSAGSLFTKIYNGSGDTQTNANGMYAQMGIVNRSIRNWGDTLVRLTPITTEGIPGYTTSIMFLRGKDANGTLTTIPDGFVGDPDSGGANATYTDWVYQRNDPFLRGWSVTNKAAVKNSGYPGDVILSWFKPLDESFDGPDYSNETYLMVVNGLTDPTGTAADCLQEITLNFNSNLGAVEMLNPLTGLAELQQLTLTNGVRQLILNLNGGEAALLKFPDGAPFVGAQQVPVTGAPIITIHPVSRENLLGTDATFTAHAYGPAPLNYQWQFNGSNIPGATTNTYTQGNVQFTNGGNYTLVVSNLSGSVTSSPAVLTLVSAQPFFYEPFDYSNVGGPVSVNTPANWTSNASAATNDFKITSGSLSYPGLVTTGNSATNGGIGLGNRRLFGTNINSGVVYFSVLFKMIDPGYGTWTAGNMPAQVASLMATNNANVRLGILLTSNTSSTYLVGVQKGSGATMDSTPRNIGDTLFLVGKYDFTSTPNPVTLWINPSTTSFGAAIEPPSGSVITTTTGLDFNSTNVIDRFNFRQNTAASVPAAMQWDELRLGNSWRDVTPILPPPTPAMLTNVVRLADGTFQFSYTTSNAQAGSVYASTNLVSWTFLGTPTQTSPGVYQFNDATATSFQKRFYQLRIP